MTQQRDSVVPEIAQAKKNFGTKTKAILAGGMVLGVGAAITLAAWTDTEWATGTFGGGSFGIEGSSNGTDWGEHPTTGAAAALDFQVNADKLTPGDAVYAGFAVQLITSSQYEATVAFAQNTTPALPAGITASHKLITSATCDETTFAASSNTATSFDLAAVTTPQYLCFQVAADAALVQGAAGSVSWTFTATSGDTL